MINIGIDLGKLGAICILRHDEIVFKCVMPLMEDGELNISEILNVLMSYPRPFVVFEDITPLHLASKKSNWSLARQSGAIEALCVALKLDYTMVPAKVWQKDMFSALPPLRDKNGSSDTKGLAFIAAKTLFPTETFLATKRSSVPHNGIVDAVCLAYYGFKNL